MGSIAYRWRAGTWFADAGEREHTGALLAAAFEWEGYADEGWRAVAPAGRLLALDGAAVVGSQSLFRLRCEPASIAVIGFGDLAVAARYRHRGIARELITRALDAVERRGQLGDYDAMLVATVALRTTFVRHGFAPVEAGQLRPGRSGAGEVARSWLVKVRPGAVVRDVRVIDDDF
jgi:predicted N-acetyltransferase YhbS